MRSTELLAYYRRVAEQSLTVVDVETTGSIANRNRMTEISVLQATLSEGMQRQQTDLLNPRATIPAKIVEVTGITQTMVNAAPLAAEVLPNYLPLLNQGILTGHNLEFDYKFLQAEYNRLGIRFVRSPTEQLCTVLLSRLMLSDLPSRSLPYLVKHFGFQVGQSHRAGADAIACWLLAKRLLVEIQNETDEVLLTRFARQWMPLKYVSKLMGCSRKEAQKRLEAAGVYVHKVGRDGKTVEMYRRGDVERVLEH